MASFGMSRSPWRWLRLVLREGRSRAEERPVRRVFIGHADYFGDFALGAACPVQFGCDIRGP